MCTFVWLRKPLIWKKGKLYYMDSDNFIFYIKTKDIYADIAKRCSNYETDRPLPKATDKTAIPLMKR